MDDILREIERLRAMEKLEEINNLHKNLKFTMEVEEQESPSHPVKLPYLSLSVIHDVETGRLSSTWYNKPTDTGLIMNYHALAPKRYKRSVVSGFVYRIHQSCSSWENFHLSLEKAKRILERNQYPPTFYDPIIKETLEKIFTSESKSKETTPQNSSTVKTEKFLLKVQYRGKCTDDYARALHKAQAPCTVVMTLRKLKTVLPSLKEPVMKMLKSGVVYKIVCPSCSASYVGETTRHLQVRFKEHIQRAGPMKTHLSNCKTTLAEKDIDILQTTSRGEAFLLTLEALHQREIKPAINTKEEYKSRELKILI